MLCWRVVSYEKGCHRNFGWQNSKNQWQICSLLLWQIIPHAPGLDKGFMNRFACSPSRSLDWFGKLCRTRFTTSLLHKSQIDKMNTCLGDCHLGGPSSCYFFTPSDTVKIIKFEDRGMGSIWNTTWHSRKQKMEPKGILEKKKTWPQSTNVWVPSSVFGEFTLIFRYCSYLQLGVVATCKPLPCFAMFCFIPLAHWRWWVWHVMTPCICWFNDFRLF